LGARARAALAWPAEANPAAGGAWPDWTPADVPLLDELAELLGTDDALEREQARRESLEREQAVAYAQEVLSASGAGDGMVSDGAQELSAMAWRAVLRRNPTRSMTVVGDVAQTSPAAAARSWSEALDSRLRDGWRLETLSVNYRTPASIMAAAHAVAVAADP